MEAFVADGNRLIVGGGVYGARHDLLPRDPRSHRRGIRGVPQQDLRLDYLSGAGLYNLADDIGEANARLITPLWGPGGRGLTPARQ